MVVRIPTSLWLELKGVAKEDERTVSDWIFVTLQDALANRRIFVALQDALANRRASSVSAAAATAPPRPPAPKSMARSEPGPRTKRLAPKKFAPKKKL